MYDLKNVIVTRILPPQVVYSKKSRIYKTSCRTTYGLTFCQSGQITYTMNGKKYVSRPGTAILLPQGGAYRLFGDATGWFPLINFECTNLKCEEIIVFPLQHPQSCIKDFEALNNLFINGRSPLKIYSAFYDLLDKVSYESIPQSKRMSFIIQYIEDHISSPGLSNSEIATQAYISEVYLRKLFDTFYDTSPKQYILNMRIQKAKYLLTNTEYTVTAIAEQCGFSSLYHFCRIFRNKIGMSPTEYATANRIYEI